MVQLNKGFRKIVTDRWEFANKFFKRGEKQLLCEIHRRKTGQPHQQTQQTTTSQLHFNIGPNPTYFPSLSPSRISLSPPDSVDDDRGSISPPSKSSASCADTVTALSEDNERLRQSNSVLVSELAHMRKLYNDIIYFVQNHAKPVPASSNYLAKPPISFEEAAGRGMNLEDQSSKTKLFGVPLHSKKRLHPGECVDTKYKACLVLGKDDLGLNLKPPRSC
ncbi:hypothetical protein Cgig2_000670 [Carnegiea gigantea]|uniref:Uncharacterized protein n=1 Tax=Carnegiea gigantea TaxID=171969 RepID=A0A9Q1Q528_9CARY|nr:hypothetical protein Cgig2_000670 [Carnegiea gigantea]